MAEENLDIPIKEEVVKSPVAGVVPKKAEGTINKDGFIKGQVIEDLDYQLHMAKLRQKK